MPRAVAPDAKPKPKRRTKARPAPQVVKVIRLQRAGGITWAARYQDPATGKTKQESLTRVYGITEEGAARLWAQNKADALRDLRKAISAGQAVTTQTTVADAVKLFNDTKRHELALGTLEVYAEALTPFTAWAAGEGLTHIESLTPAKLTAFRDWLVAQPAYGQLKKHGLGKGKAARVPSKRKPSPETINKKLRAMRTVAGFWRQRRCPHLTTDAIRDSLKFVKVKRKAPAFLRAPEIRALLQAVARHDAELDDGKGHTHPPIGDFLQTALLSGMRFAELTALTWRAVDLDAREIRLSENDTKTGHARTVDLDVSPALHALLTHRRVAAGGNPWVFGTTETDSKGKPKHRPMRRDVAEAARKRLVKDYDAPAFYWHLLRKTAGTFLTCAPAIYGAASAFMAAKRQGHSVAISEKHYAGQVKGISPDARTLEAAMQVVDLLPAPAANLEDVA